MKDITILELRQLEGGTPPKGVRQGWDCATVIPWLAQSLLGVLVDEMTIGQAKELIERKERVETILSE